MTIIHLIFEKKKEKKFVERKRIEIEERCCELFFGGLGRCNGTLKLIH
jgi:hypothetical protein